MAYDWQPLPPSLLVPPGGQPQVTGPPQDGSFGPRPDLEAKRTRDASGEKTVLYRKIPRSRRLSSSKPASVSPSSAMDGLSGIAELPLLASINRPFQEMANDSRGVFLQE